MRRSSDDSEATPISQDADTEGSPAPLAGTVEEACRRWSSRPAVSAGGTTLTYGELWQRVVSLAAAYEQRGIGRGDRVLCQLRNSAEHVAAIAAAWVRGAVHVGVDNDLTGAELARLVERFDAAALLYQPATGSDDPLGPLRAVAETAPGTRLIVQGVADGFYDQLETLLETQGSVAPDLPGPLDTAVVFLTSGTTGEPKAVVESLSAHWAKMQLFTDAFEPGPDDVHLLFLPIAHVFGLRLALLALLRGGHLVLLERFSPDRALEVIADRHVTVLPAVPAHLRLLRARLDPDHHDTTSLRWVLSAASGLPRQLAEWVYDALGARILYVFGCSEGFTTVTTDRQDILAGSVGNTVFRGPPGTPADGTVTILQPGGDTPVPVGEEGEIAFGARMPVAYWDHPDAATDGWYRTGDLGRIDADGRVFIVGRLKELINRGGLHVSSAEVEMALVRHPAIADAGVIAVPDPVLGEAVCACIAVGDARRPNLAELREFLSQTLARHKLPDELCVVDAVPRTVIGKVDRPVLSARVADGAVPRERTSRDDC